LQTRSAAGEVGVVRYLGMVKYLGLGLVVAGGLFVVAAAHAADSVVYQLSWIPGGESAPAYVAKKEGIFDAAGLDVKIMSGRGTMDSIAKVSNGVADFGEASLDALLGAEAENAIPVKAVMTLFVKVPDALVTTTTSGMKTLKDVAGRKVATSPFTSSNQPWPLVLKMNGVDPDSVTMLKVDAGTLPALLASGQVDGILNWVTSVPVAVAALKDAGKTVKVFPWSDYGYEGYSQSVIASNKMLAERPEVARKFLIALREGERRMKADPAKSAAAIKELVPETDLADNLGQIEVVNPITFNEVSDRDGLGIFNPALVATTWDWVAKERNLPHDKLDPMKFVDTSYLVKD
jgi:NitT/TauT family transport system substrate-binding protein